MKTVFSSSPDCIYVCCYLDLAAQHSVVESSSLLLETYLGWGFLLLIGVDRDGQSRGHAALWFGLTGPVTALLTLRQGVICAGTAAIIHPHRPVTPCKHPCWWKQRKVFPLTTAAERDCALLLPGGCHFSWPATFDMCPPSDCDWTGDVFKVGQHSRYARMKYFLLAAEKERVMCSSLWSLVKSAHLHRGPASGFWSANFHEFISETGSKAGPQRLSYQVHRVFLLFKDTCKST